MVRLARKQVERKAACLNKIPKLMIGRWCLFFTCSYASRVLVVTQTRRPYWLGAERDCRSRIVGSVIVGATHVNVPQWNIRYSKALSFRRQASLFIFILLLLLPY